jgi:hypothetical protein
MTTFLVLSSMELNMTAIYGAYDYSHYEKYVLCPKTSRSYPFLEAFRYQRSRCDTQLHVAALVRRGKVLAFATNQTASRSSGASSRGSQTHIHAEKNLLSRIPHYLLRGSSIYVMRIKENIAEFRYSQPCPECTVLLNKCMRSYGLRNVYFTVWIR